jgi:hypothetical protein
MRAGSAAAATAGDLGEKGAKKVGKFRQNRYNFVNEKVIVNAERHHICNAVVNTSF